MACELTKIYMGGMCLPVGGGNCTPYIIPVTIAPYTEPNCYEYTLGKTMGEISEHIGENMVLEWDDSSTIQYINVLTVKYEKDDSSIYLMTGLFGPADVGGLVGMIEFEEIDPDNFPYAVVCQGVS